MKQIIIDAINNKQQLKITYNGTARVVNPHAYGYDKHGHLKLRGFQQAKSAEHQGWRLFNEAAIEEVEVLDSNFPSPAFGYHQDDKQLARIIAQL